MKMLIADDNRAILEVLQRYAQDEGFQVTTAEDGETAWELCQKQDFSVILLDVMMPGLTALRSAAVFGNSPWCLS